MPFLAAAGGSLIAWAVESAVDRRRAGGRTVAGRSRTPDVRTGEPVPAEGL
ncbi:hypothetical protein [Couchioplanes azureus]|uniref:hypothetical protein n=1 Tax=Couchioplanes caeruleus TaxID=56438 RepID=UPI00166F6C86|nr:hypothetical protein [Couchioplanes caeruleus]